MAIKILRHEFLKLAEEIESKFRRECAERGDTPPESQKEFYGYDEFNQGQATSIRYYLSDLNQRVTDYLAQKNGGKEPHVEGFQRVNGRDLYERILKFERNPDLKEMALKGIYEFVYFYYLDFDSIHDFRKTHFPKGSSSTVTFTHFYYSYLSHSVKQGEVEMTFDPLGITATQKGFYRQREHVLSRGKGTKLRSCLRLALQSDEGDFMDMYIHTENKDPKTALMMLGIFVTPSANGYPVAVETVLVKKPSADEEANLSEADKLEVESGKLQIERFLFLKRNHFRSSDPGYTNLNNLRIKRPLVSMIEFLSGKQYRVWSYSKSGNIVQVRWVFERNYKATLYAPPEIYGRNEQKQLCLLSISDAVIPRLIVTFHPDQGSGMLGTSILAIPDPLRSKLFTGVTCSVGLRSGHPTISFIAVMHDESAFESKIIPYKEIGDEVKEDENLQKLLNELNNKRYDSDSEAPE